MPTKDIPVLGYSSTFDFVNHYVRNRGRWISFEFIFDQKQKNLVTRLADQEDHTIVSDNVSHFMTDRSRWVSIYDVEVSSIIVLWVGWSGRSSNSYNCEWKCEGQLDHYHTNGKAKYGLVFTSLAILWNQWRSFAEEKSYEYEKK